MGNVNISNDDLNQVEQDLEDFEDVADAAAEHVSATFGLMGMGLASVFGGIAPSIARGITGLEIGIGFLGAAGYQSGSLADGGLGDLADTIGDLENAVEDLQDPTAGMPEVAAAHAAVAAVMNQANQMAPAHSYPGVHPNDLPVQQNIANKARDIAQKSQNAIRSRQQEIQEADPNVGGVPGDTFSDDDYGATSPEVDPDYDTNDYGADEPNSDPADNEHGDAEHGDEGADPASDADPDEPGDAEHGDGTPIIIDLDGDGIEILLSSQNIVAFDMDNDGYREQTSWVAPDDGLLVIDLGLDGVAGPDGVIDQTNEVILSEWTENPNDTDLEAVAAVFDTNSDGVFSSLDERWSEFRIWQDINSDGTVDDGELKALSYYSIDSIQLTYTNGQGYDSVEDDRSVGGNTLLGTSSARNSAGVDTHLVGDVSFTYRTNGWKEIESENNYQILLESLAGDFAKNIYVLSANVAPDFAFSNPLITGARGDGRDNVIDGSLSEIGLEISGGLGNDLLTGGFGNDAIIGDDGADQISAGAGNDIVFANSSEDIVDGGEGYDYLILSDNVDISYVLGQNNFEALISGAGNDTITVDSSSLGRAIIFGDDGDDSLSGGVFSDSISGDDGDDILFGGGGLDVLVGGAGSDIIHGDDQDDFLFGGSGDDTLYGGEGNDTLSAGSTAGGWQTIAGGNGSDTYRYSSNDGRVFVYDEFSSTGDFDLILIEDIEFSDVVFGSYVYSSSYGTALTISSSEITSNHELRISQDASHIEFFQFADSTLFSRAFLPNDASILSTTPTWSGTAADDAIVLGVEAMAVTITGGSGNDTIGTMGGGYDWNYLSGGNGSDHYQYFKSGQRAFITGEEPATSGANDVVRLMDLELADITFDKIEYQSTHGTALRLLWADDGATGELRVSNMADGIEELRFSDQSRLSHVEVESGTGAVNLYGTTGGDFIIAAGGGNTIYGGDGKDTIGFKEMGADWNYLYGGEGNDLYRFFGGAGKVFISGEATNEASEYNVISFEEANLSDLTISAYDYGPGHNLGSALQFTEALDDGLSELRVANAGVGIDLFQFADGSSVTSVVVGAPGEPVTLYGSAEDEVINAGHYDTHIISYDGNDILQGGDGNDILDGGAGNDSLFSGAGDDHIILGLGANIIDGGAGFDTLSMADSTQGFVVNLGPNTADGEYNGYVSHLGVIDGEPLDDVRNIESVIGSDQNDVMLGGMIDGLRFYGESGNDLLRGSEGSQSIFGGAGDDGLSGGAGEDWLAGNLGNDRYDYSIGDGFDRISEALGGEGGGTDTISFGSGINAVDVYIRLESTDMLIYITEVGQSYYETDDIIRVNGWTTEQGKIERLKFSDGTIFLLDPADGIFPTEGDDLLSWAAAEESIVSLIIRGGAGNDTLDGGLGNDFLNGMDGDDIIRGDDGDDEIYGASGDDYLRGDDDDDYIDGGDGNDSVYGNNGDDFLIGGAGADVLGGWDGDDVVQGGSEGDTLLGQNGLDVLFGDAGDDFIYGHDGADEAHGGAGADYIDGGLGNDLLLGGDGDDTLLARAGDDEIYAEDGNDTAFGYEGDDTILGGLGNDVLDGGLDNDQLVGEDGDDDLRGREGDDLLLGNDGNDVIRGYQGNDTINGGSGVDDLFGDDGDDVIDGGNDNDTLRGHAGNDILSGEAGDDILIGHAGDDTLVGGLGNDTIRGDEGSDSLFGGAGSDLFVINFGIQTDIINDFDVGIDQLDLRSIALANFTSFQALTTNNSSGDAVIDLGNGDSVTMLGIVMTDLSAQDVLL